MNLFEALTKPYTWGMDGSGDHAVYTFTGSALEDGSFPIYKVDFFAFPNGGSSGYAGSKEEKMDKVADKMDLPRSRDVIALSERPHVGIIFKSIGEHGFGIDRTGFRDSIRVLATVVDIVKSYVEDSDYDLYAFTGHGKLGGVYARIIKMLSRDYNLSVVRDGSTFFVKVKR